MKRLKKRTMRRRGKSWHSCLRRTTAKLGRRAVEPVSGEKRLARVEAASTWVKMEAAAWLVEVGAAKRKLSATTTEKIRSEFNSLI